MRKVVAFTLAALALGPVSAAAQYGGMNGSWLEWQDLQIAIAPDSTGMFFWMAVGRSLSQNRQRQEYYARFDPGATKDWTARAREFLRVDLANDDTGSVRVSPVLRLLNGNQMYVARRRSRDKWTNERIVVFESPKGTEPIILNGERGVLDEMLDTLDAVADRTPFSLEAVRAEMTPMLDVLDRATRPPVPSPHNLSPPYPEDERKENHQGAVVLSFVVGVDGRADMSSLKVLYARSPAFLEVCRRSLASFRFTPAERGGVPVAMRVNMPFQFALRAR